MLQSKPSTNLKHLVQFCMEVYFLWFEIKRKHTIVDGAKNFFNIVNRVTKLPNVQIRTQCASEKCIFCTSRKCFTGNAR